MKADKSELNVKADKSYVDSSLDLKANVNDLSVYATINNVDASLANYATKNDVSAFITANDVSIYAEKTYVDSSLALKANTSYVEMTFAKVVILTLQQYTDLQVKDSSTLYIISDN